MGLTPHFAIPYADPDDYVVDGPAAFQAFAERVDTVLKVIFDDTVPSYAYTAEYPGGQATPGGGGWLSLALGPVGVGHGWSYTIAPDDLVYSGPARLFLVYAQASVALTDAPDLELRVRVSGVDTEARGYVQSPATLGYTQVSAGGLLRLQPGAKVRLVASSTNPVAVQRAQITIASVGRVD